MRILPIVLCALQMVSLCGCRDTAPGIVRIDSILSEARFGLIARGEWRSQHELSVVVATPAFPVYGRSIGGSPSQGSVVEVLSLPKRERQEYEFVVLYREDREEADVLALLPVYDGVLSGVVDEEGGQVMLETFLKMIKKTAEPGATDNPDNVQ